MKNKLEIESADKEEEESVLNKAKMDENVAKHLEGKEIIKSIVVPNKIVNIVVK